MGVLLLLWGSFSAVSKLLLTRLDSFQVQFYMFGMAFLIMTANMFSKNNREKLRSLQQKELVKLMLFALPSFFYYFLYTLALRMIPAIEASMLNYLFPIMIVVFAIPINHEKVNTSKLVSILLGFAGVLVVITNGKISNLGFSNLAGDLLAIGAAVCWGIFSNVGKRNKVDQTLSNYIYVLVSFALSGIGVLIFSRITIPDTASFIGILWISLSSIVLAYPIWFRILKGTTSALAASMSFVTPFVTLGFIMLLLGEKLGMIQVAGFLLILAGIALQNFKSSKLLNN